MTVLALLCCPWIETQLRIPSIIPRDLADDLCSIAISTNPIEAIIKSTNEAHLFIHSIGGTCAPSKSKMYATTHDLRTTLKAIAWQHLNATIPTVHDL